MKKHDYLKMILNGDSIESLYDVSEGGYAVNVCDFTDCDFGFDFVDGVATLKVPKHFVVKFGIMSDDTETTQFDLVMYVYHDDLLVAHSHVYDIYDVYNVLMTVCM